MAKPKTSINDELAYRYCAALETLDDLGVELQLLCACNKARDPIERRALITLGNAIRLYERLG
jgi:hypothetical protein